MRRRTLLTLLAGTAIAPPLDAGAQQNGKVPVIGYLNSNSPERTAPLVAAFRAGLKDTGYVEGDNVAIEFRWAEGHYDRLPALAADLVARKVDVIDRWREAAMGLLEIIERDDKKVDLRYVSEYAAAGSSVPYHIYFYNEPRYGEVPHPPSETVIAMLEEVSIKYDAEPNKNSELMLRLGIQIYANICGTYMFQYMIPMEGVEVNFKNLQLQGWEYYLERLKNLVSTSAERVSYFVLLVEKAVSLQLSDESHLEQYTKFMNFIKKLESSSIEILEYDRKKIHDLHEYFRDRADAATL